MLGALAAAACGTGTGTGPTQLKVADAGPPVDAGFYYTRPSIGAATFSGAISGTWSAEGLASASSLAFALPDGGSSGAYVSFVVVDTTDLSGDAGNPQFSCSFLLFSTPTLPTGALTLRDVSSISCAVIVTDGGIEQDWGFEPSAFEMNISSTGPSNTVGTETIWLDPSVSLSVSLAPNPAGPGAGVSFLITLAPPPCPTYCAPNP